MSLWIQGLSRGRERAGPNEIRSFIKCKFFQYGPRSEHKSSPYKTHSRNRSTTQLSSYEHGAKISAQVHGERVKDENSDRDLLLSVLSSTSTTREARSYLSRFTPLKKPRPEPLKQIKLSKDPIADSQRYESGSSNRSGVNLGGLYVHKTRAIDTSPVFAQNTVPEPMVKDTSEPLHIALVKLRAPHLLSDVTLEGVGYTLSQLRRLGLSSVVVVDCEELYNVGDRKQETGDWRRAVVHQADRVAAAIDSHKGPGARRLDNIIELCAVNEEIFPTISGPGNSRVTFRELILAPLRRGVIPIIPPIGYVSATQTAVSVSSDDIVLALAREFAGIMSSTPDEDSLKTFKRNRALQTQISLDKMIILDPLGGIPSRDRPDSSHVFINMEQEFQDIQNELLTRTNMAVSPEISKEAVLGQRIASSTLTSGNAYSESAQTRDISSNSSTSNGVEAADGRNPSEPELQIRNLYLTQQVLAILPPTASAIITTPEEAANSGRPSAAPFRASGVGTRRQKNPLIHNLLTDKPAYSSSLPVERLTRSEIFNHMPPHIQASPTTFAKKGMPVTILPDPRISPWTPPRPGDPLLTLDDPRIDLSRLVYLIEDSFNRKLDVPKYLERVNKRVAGVIIAGGYEGGAILTWECPPGVSDDGSEASRLRMVPYLDKFAVLKRSQGAGGVADIVFKAMVRTCFPNGVTWRSRKDNPVNKWYFERSRGTWKIPNTNWTMFWTTEGLLDDKQTFLDYQGVSRGIVPSWADNKAIAD